MYAVVFHAHQKLDRVAHRHLIRMVGEKSGFPTIRQILYFEGRRGPDASKLKNNPEAGEQPWHFVDPFNEDDVHLASTIQAHYEALVKALKEANLARTSFESAWLAHALVDGLTPAHHYPYEAELEALRGQAKHSRTSVVRRLTVRGSTHRDTITRSYKLVGPKGLLMSHTAFEAGAYVILLPLRLERAFPPPEEIEAVRTLGLPAYFRRLAKEIGVLDMYGRFYKYGWTPKLARQVRRELAPRMAMIITLAWYSALIDAGLVKEQ